MRFVHRESLRFRDMYARWGASRRRTLAAPVPTSFAAGAWWGRGFPPGGARGGSLPLPTGLREGAILRRNGGFTGPGRRWAARGRCEGATLRRNGGFAGPGRRGAARGRRGPRAQRTTAAVSVRSRPLGSKSARLVSPEKLASRNMRSFAMKPTSKTKLWAKKSSPVGWPLSGLFFQQAEIRPSTCSQHAVGRQRGPREAAIPAQSGAFTPPACGPAPTGTREAATPA